MKMYVISDNVDTHTGMRLAGVEGEVLHGEAELSSCLERVTGMKDVGILLLSEGFLLKYPDIVNTFKQNHSMPLVVEIPDRHGSGRRADFITAYAGDAIGLKI
ncbi:MAG: V-type ATP synthase subunit F [Lachnospiraceae bacterium]|nr:V-type ATP synthase subunit F [Lachnospiraceae bacterium]